MDNLRRMPPILKEWNKKVFRNLREKIELCKSNLSKIHSDQSIVDDISMIREEEDNLALLLKRRRFFGPKI